MKIVLSFLILITTVFSSGVSAQELRKAQTYIGIGIVVQQLADGLVKIDDIVPYAPAARAGILPEDIVTEIRSLPTSAVIDVRTLSLEEFVALVRGPEGVPVALTIRRGPFEIIDFSIIREKFEVDDKR